MITTINEFKNQINEGVAAKDWDRMLKLYMANDEGERVASSLKDKNKAIARFVAGLKLSNTPLNYDADGYRPYSGKFDDFGNKAITLGATPEEIQAVYDNTEVPQKYTDKKSSLQGKGLDSWVINKVSQAILDMGLGLNYTKRGGNALTGPGRDAMSRNGRKWTMGYKSEITINGEVYPFDFDVITSESVEREPSYFTAAETSHRIFNSLKTWEPMGVREFVKKLKEILDREMNKDTTVTESTINEGISAWDFTKGFVSYLQKTLPNDMFTVELNENTGEIKVKNDFDESAIYNLEEYTSNEGTFRQPNIPDTGSV